MHLLLKQSLWTEQEYVCGLKIKHNDLSRHLFLVCIHLLRTLSVYLSDTDSGPHAKSDAQEGNM